MSSINERNWFKKIIETYQINDFGNVLDVGSLDINGSVREFLPHKTYTGIDMMGGPNVDRVMNAHDISFEFGMSEFDTLVCANTLEHDNEFWHTLLAMNYVLKPGGYLFVVTPTFGFPIHRHPKDYYRFGEDAFREVIFDPKQYKLLNLEEVPTKEIDGKGVNYCLCGFGKKL